MSLPCSAIPIADHCSSMASSGARARRGAPSLRRPLPGREGLGLMEEGVVDMRDADGGRGRAVDRVVCGMLPCTLAVATTRAVLPPFTSWCL